LVKKRTRPAKPKAKRDQVAGGMPTKEWRQHHSDAVVENRDIKGTKGVRALSQSGNAFDRYYRRTELAPGDRRLNAIRYSAGERLRGDWERAGLDTRARQSFERRDGSTEEFSVARLDAWNRVRAAMVVLGATRFCVLNAAVYGRRIGKAKIEMLRVGLDALVDMYAGRK
jgi:hypothetical protein